ncbi:MAG: TSUP family transporter [Clostridia bacterium]|nr:TSUP family transporter [Clostridia bacterium]
MFFSDISTLTPEVFLIVCPLVFLAGLLDAVAGGGALISIPAYLISGVPVHTAIATNKLSASFGAAVSAARFIKNKMVSFKLGIPSVFFAVSGSALGANLSMRMNESVMMKVLLVILPLAAFIVLNKRIFHDNLGEKAPTDKKTFIIVMTVAFLIGIYDGFFGPGAGTFTIICLTVFAKMNIKTANAQTKLINLTTTVSALAVFFAGGQVIVTLGIAAGLCNMLGSWIGAGLAMKKGSLIIKPALLIVLLLLGSQLLRSL